MSDVVTLTLRAPLEQRLEIDGLTADRCATLSEGEIAALPAWLGSRAAQVGDFFDVRGGAAAHLRFEGALERVDGLGAHNAGGEIVIDGKAGARVAAHMTGGRVIIRGSAGDDAGMAMGGGLLRIEGDAGDRLGAPSPGAAKGMSGGEIIVGGSVGREAMARARRGLVVVSGNVGADAARAMLAGTLVVFGSTAATPGRGNKRGSIVAVGSIEVPRSYTYACTFEPAFVRLLMTYLRRQYQLAIDERVIGGRFRRYCGDRGDPGKGEILEYDKP